MNSATQIILLLAVFSQFRFTNACHGDDCRQLVFPAYLIRTGSRLFGHNVTIKLVRDIDECEWHCYQHPCCVSINFRTIANTEKLHRCELNNATSKTFENNLVPQKGFIYREAESACESNTCENGAICQSGYTDKGYRCVCHSCFASSHAERAPKSCKDIRDKGVCHGDGEYWIDPANDGKHLKVFCDMTTDGGGWLLVSRLNITHETTDPSSQLPWEASYCGIANDQMLLKQTAMKELRALINFTQLRFHCKKEDPGRTFHIATVKNSSGEAVVRYLSGQTDVLPHACDSFYKMSDDDSNLANECRSWGKDDGKYSVGKWGHEMDAALESDLNETRLFNHAAFVKDKYHWLLGDRFECDDDSRSQKTISGDNFWEVFVR
ncbi:uncharacterized protein LOC141879022 [Acropora palmata]|uniref:uncharacterized protein LOC141879022 n=1 Tax=Acropora palmata TaxID=6131 RepID=UPI003DA0F4F9